MLEALSVLISVFAAGNVAATPVAEQHAQSQVEAPADAAAESRSERIARMRAKMRSSQPRASRVRCVHAACDPCDADADTPAKATLIAHSSVNAARGRAIAQPSSCDQSAA